MEITIIKVLLPAVVSFIAGILITPLITHYLYKYKAWKKQGGKTAIGGQEAKEFNRLKGESETKTPRMGGIVIWGSVLISTIIIYFLTKNNSFLSPEVFFLSRSQTWIPFSTLFIGAFLGLINDFYDIKHGGKGVRLSLRLLLITAISGFIGFWFYSKLGITSVGIPFSEPLELGFFIIPFFILLTLAIYASGVIDGIDGLSGGVFAIIFSAYSGVAILLEQYDLAAFCALVTGSILAFLWYNIPPARFWMTETGSMALTLTLAVVVFMTDRLAGENGFGIFLLPIIGFLLLVTVFSNILQLIYRKFTGKKLFKIAPIHHHFEAIGWPSYKVTMRYWIIGMICAFLGLILATILRVI